MHRHQSSYLTATPRVSVAANGTELPHSPYITQQICCFRHPQKKMFQLPRSVTCLARHLLDLHQVTKTSNKNRRRRFSSQITWTCGLSGIYCWFWNWTQFNVLPCSSLSLSLSLLPHQRIRRPRSGWPAVRSARLASYLGKVVSSLQSIFTTTWSLYCDTAAFRLLLIGSWLTIDFYRNLVNI